MEEYQKLTDLILDWNEKINVTAIKDKDEFYTKNIVDSLTICKLEEYVNSSSVLDMGTGGGFPGLPLAMHDPSKSFLLCDSVGKKLTVVSDVAKKLGLSNVKTFHGRAEDIGHDKALRESFDLVVSRAVANMSTLSEYCLPLVKLGGFFIAYKTKDSMEEIEAAKKAVSLLGGSSYKIYDDGIDGSGHLFVVIKKLSSTSSKYPRKAGDPSRKPL